ncbi:AraC family transcriptional regulator [Gorillibacterium sp. sgz500922]|uniref:AraC family transcriptional regulator n=1 Tax=Gorillibacterium sp. sgz500922 TaxID=3446694 RepID=UPI003F67AEF1
MKIPKCAVSNVSGDTQGVHEAEMARIARLIYTYAPTDGLFDGRIPGLYIGRTSRIYAEGQYTIYTPSIGFAVQGTKKITVGPDVYTYTKSSIFVAPLAFPARIQITQASPSEPFLGLRLDLDPQRIAELVLKVYSQGMPSVRRRSAGYVINADLSMINAVTRLIECQSDSMAADFVAPLVMDEILIRLLCSPVGVHVAELGVADSSL